MAKKHPEQRRPMYLPSPTSEVQCRGKDDGCCGIFYLKHVLYVFNFIFLVSGCVVLCVGLWTFFLKHSFVSLLASNLFTVTTYLLIVTGGTIILFIFTLGCIGACRENSCLLMTFAAFLMLVFMLEAVIGVMAYLYEAALRDELGRSLNATMLSTHRIDEEKTRVIDEMQQYFRCCGAANYSDWYYRPNTTVVESRYNSCESSESIERPDWVFSSSYDEMNRNLAVPESCCMSPCHGCTRRIHPSNIFTSGCLASLEQYFGDHLIVVGAVGLGLCSLEIFGIIFSCCLAKKIKLWKERQKTYWR